MSSLRAAEDEAPVVTVLFSAEAHGALLPCDCPLQLIGGVARRATLIKQYRARGPVVVVDAGNWAAGGLYDEDSDGDPVRDKLRTELMAQTLAKMGYDFVGWAEAERQAWLAAGDGKALSWPGTLYPDPADLIVRYGQTKDWGGIFIDRASTRVSGFWLNPAEKADALSLPSVNVQIHPTPPIKVVAYPFGEEASQRFAEKNGLFVDLVLNAGRKSSTRVAWTAGQSVIANFDYQVQRMGVAEVRRRPGWKAGDPGPRWDIRVKQVPLTKEIPEDPEVLALLKPHLETLKKKGKRQVSVEFFMLSECPYCKDVVADLEQIAKDLSGRVEIVPHFLVRKTPDDKFRSLHGERELAENRIQALVFRYYPERFWEWVKWRYKNPGAPWEEGVKALDLLRPRLAMALAAGEADEILERDHQLALRRHVEATPALVIANRTYDGEYERLKVLRVLCGLLDEPRPEVCKTVPACFHDGQCRKRGFIGRCVEPGKPTARCDYSQKAVAVPATVLVEKDMLFSNHERILEILLGYLPGLEWKIVDPSEGEGRVLAEKAKAERYPAYLLDPSARKEVGFEENLGAATEAREGFLVVKGQLAGASRIVARERVRGRADLFVSRFSKPGQEAVDVALEMLALPLGRRPEVVFHDGLYWQETVQPDGKVKRELAARGGLVELQEAAVALALREVAPEKLNAYLRERGLRRGSLFWDRALGAAGVDVEKVRALAEGPDQKGPVERIARAMRAEADLLAALKSGGDVVLLAENCELIPLRSREDLRYYLELIGKRRPDGPARP